MLPLNSKCLTALLLRQMARGLAIPTSRGIVGIWTFITEKINEMEKNLMDMQVTLQEGEERTSISL